jgi:citrate lyase subunit beta/citryl-CoA lyase
MRAILILSAGVGEPPLDDVLASGASALLLRLGPDDTAAARDEARLVARAFLERARTRIGRPPIFVQVASVRTPNSEGDLDAVVAPGLDGVFLEGCEGRGDVQQLATRLAVREAALGLPEGGARIVALAAQTPAGVFSLGDYGGASPRLTALALDEKSLPGGDAAQGVARALLALGAAAAGVPALVAAPLAGDGDFEAACRAAGREGFSGLMTPRTDEIPAIGRALA